MTGTRGKTAMMIARVLLVLSLLAGSPVFAGPAPERGDAARSGPIMLGMSTALSGPVSVLGRAMKLGVDVALREANVSGGVRGRKLDLVALDDSYDPETAASNVARLIHDHGVLAIIGNVGTPTARVSIPIAKAHGVLFYGALSGADLLRPDPADQHIINFRAGYRDEVTTMINGLTGLGIKPAEIGFFTQNDSYGTSVHANVVNELTVRGYDAADTLPHGRYPRNTLIVEPALVDLMEAPTKPRAIIMVGAYAPSAKFIRLARQVFPDCLFLNVSFVGSGPLRKALGSAGEGVIVTEVVPPVDADLPGVAAFRDAVARFAPADTPTTLTRDVAALEGYSATRLLIEGLARAPALTRAGVIDGMEAIGVIDQGLGTRLSLGPDKHQASDRVWPVVIRDGKYEALDWDTAQSDVGGLP